MEKNDHDVDRPATKPVLVELILGCGNEPLAQLRAPYGEDLDELDVPLDGFWSTWWRSTVLLAKPVLGEAFSFCIVIFENDLFIVDNIKYAIA